MSKESVTLLQGTLDLLILRTLRSGALHGHGITKEILRTSDELLRVEHGSLYPALHRLEKRGWLTSRWRETESVRPMKFYSLTPLGRKQLTAEQTKWEQVAKAIRLVLRQA